MKKYLRSNHQNRITPESRYIGYYTVASIPVRFDFTFRIKTGYKRKFSNKNKAWNNRSYSQAT
jgi:hypothetical protein